MLKAIMRSHHFIAPIVDEQTTEKREEEGNELEFRRWIHKDNNCPHGIDHIMIKSGQKWKEAFPDAEGLCMRDICVESSVCILYIYIMCLLINY